MGNCWGSKSVDVNPSFSNTEPSTPATTQKTNLDTGILGTSNGYSTGGGLSGTTNSSAAQSGFSVAASDDGYANGEILPSSNLKVYTFADMKSATRGFKSDSVLGIGGFGTVFKGWVDEKTLAPARSGAGMVVAIKKLNHESMQGFQEWQSEVNFLGRLSHPNLVKLLGYCWEDEELLLVYEFLSKGSLENHLFRRSSTVEPLSWDIRIKIALGAARGLAFLHGSEKKIIYRDFKASNILLDADYNAKISDFGLAKLGPSVGESHVTTRIMGTYGYAAPEYIATGHLYVTSDVYGFGVVLLELLSGLRVYDTKRPVGNINLVEWMGPLLHSKRKVLKSVMDASIKGRYSTQAAVQTARITLKCLEPDPRKRVSMKRVVQALEEIEALKIEVKEPRQVPWRHYSSGHLYVKSDVYGFGVVLLELLSGLRALDNKRPTGQINLVEWMKPLLYSKRKLIKTVMDRRIEGQYSTKAAVEASQLTLRCLEPEPRKRASMKEVVEALEAIEALKIKAKEPRNVSSRHGSSGSSKTNPYGASRSVYRGSSR